MLTTPSNIVIRAFRDGDAPALRHVFHTSIHTLAHGEYSEAQRAAWAPDDYDEAQWAARQAQLRPFVVECDGAILAYADLQPDGYIDHFFVAGAAGGRGIGRTLLAHLLDTAPQRGLAMLYAHVSLTAQPLFARAGFVLEASRTVTTRGVAMRNALMRWRAPQA